MRSSNSFPFLFLLFSFASLILYLIITVSLNSELELETSSRDTYLTERFSPAPTNGQFSGNVDFLALNRIPNSGGEILVLILEWLQHNNSFTHHRVVPNLEKGQLQLQRHMESTEPKSSHSFDSIFLFSDSNDSKLLYITLLRDPLERLASMFYYDGVTPLPGLSTSKEYPKKQMKFPSIESCLRNRGEQCVFATNSSQILPIVYLCGQQSWCKTFNGRSALKTAMKNVVDRYSVVGILEDLDASLRVLEAKLPTFFHGASQIFSTITTNQKWQAQMKLPTLEPWAKEFLKLHLHNEFQLYEFVKKRLYEQLREIEAK